jgi:putative molybdopterin biosynthesis protein
MKRNIYLQNVSVEQAKELWHGNQFEMVETEVIDVREAYERIVSKKVIAKHSSPHYHASAMDGIALQAKITAGASEANPLTLIEEKDFIYVDTGDLIPTPYNAVLMIEDVNQLDEKSISIEKSVRPWEHIRTIGESMVKGEIILRKYQKVNAFAIGLVLEAGLTTVEVFKRPIIELIPTGTELLEPGEPLEPGKLVEYNSQVVQAMAKAWGVDVIRNSIIPDDYELIKEKVEKASKRSDFIIVLSGSSAGSEDYTSHIINALGHVDVHGVNIKPGGPVILGQVNTKPIIGLPGYPVAAALNFLLFAKEVIFDLKNERLPKLRQVKGVIKTKISSKLGYREFLRVKLSKFNGEIVVTPLKRASGVIGTMVESDGFLIISEFSEGLPRDTKVDVTLLKESVDYESTLLLNGSNDVILDLLKNEMAIEGVDLVVKSTGSLGGITSLNRKECHLSTAHLLNPETGEYNFSYIDRYLRRQKVIVINLAFRQQGMIIQKGNPKNLKSINDLVKNDITFINRQRGAGTRVLFDYLLGENNIDKNEITGYNREEYTHMTLASEIQSGSTDIGIGIQSAADAFDLDFIPIAKERYDLIIPEDLLEDQRIKTLLTVINSESFINQVKLLKGYDLSLIGKVMTNENT